MASWSNTVEVCETRLLLRVNVLLPGLRSCSSYVCRAVSSTQPVSAHYAKRGKEGSRKEQGERTTLRAQCLQ